ncbi:helix-turn-helix domain-containing protein [Lysobacter sp. CA199]|uniref:helix-turn-helix domain-containing protein n=1 Tax=Lysobacter sp. CA199 TaxID=3455608 RepID=UPI003F8D118B
MANTAALTKEQIARISRKESRKIIEPMKAQLVLLRKTVATLKNERAQFRREVATVSKGTVRSATPQLRSEVDVAEAGTTTRRYRFTAASFRKLRERLELTRPEMATLLGSSKQAVYMWETEGSQPREVFVAKIAIVKGLTKQSARQLLEAHPDGQP